MKVYINDKKLLDIPGSLSFHRSFALFWHYHKKILEMLPESLPLSSELTTDSFSSLTTGVMEKISYFRKKIFETREAFRSSIDREKSALYGRLKELSVEVLSRGTYRLPSTLQAVSDGISGTYFLKDDAGRPQMVIKPQDEEAGCIHSKKWGGVEEKNPVQRDMPLYLSSMREALGYEVAKAIGVEEVVPPTVLAILEADQFHDYSDSLVDSDRIRYLDLCGKPDREKLCSVQAFVPNSKSLFEIQHELSSMSDEEIAKRFDQKEYEETNLLIWTTYDTDAHAGNVLCYAKGVDRTGKEIWGFRKIDNGLAFPTRNRDLRNNLAYLPNGNKELSDEIKGKIANLDVQIIGEKLRAFGLECAVPAMEERVAYLQKIALVPGITIGQINKKMIQMERMNETSDTFIDTTSYTAGAYETSEQ